MFESELFLRQIVLILNLLSRYCFTYLAIRIKCCLTKCFNAILSVSYNPPTTNKNPKAQGKSQQNRKCT